jgi:uncharacterized membrane protein YGL010W
VNPRLIELFREYDQYHLDPINRLTHKVAIPLIFFNAFAMLDWIELVAIPGASSYPISVAHIAVAWSVMWYARMNPKLCILLAASFVVMLIVGSYTPKWLVVSIGVAAWVLQFLGHLVWEKKAPNFMRNGIQALVGPIYFLAIATGDWQAPAARSGRGRSFTDAGTRHDPV